MPEVVRKQTDINWKKEKIMENNDDLATSILVLIPAVLSPQNTILLL